MTQDPTGDFSSLTLDQCQALVGIDFIRRNDDGADVTLRLVEATKLKRDPRAGDEGDRPFSLVFRGPVNPRLTQGMHALENPHCPFHGIFLVPIGQDDEGFTYEAVFS